MKKKLDTNEFWVQIHGISCKYHCFVHVFEWVNTDVVNVQSQDGWRWKFNSGSSRLEVGTCASYEFFCYIVIIGLLLFLTSGEQYKNLRHLTEIFKRFAHAAYVQIDAKLISKTTGKGNHGKATKSHSQKLLKIF